MSGPVPIRSGSLARSAVLCRFRLRSLVAPQPNFFGDPSGMPSCVRDPVSVFHRMKRSNSKSMARSISVLHAHSSSACFMQMLQAYASYECCIHMLHAHAASACFMRMLIVATNFSNGDRLQFLCHCINLHCHSRSYIFLF